MKENSKNKKTDNKIPEFSGRAFWDIDMNEIDYEKHAQYVIIKILDRGKYSDLTSLFKFYGKERIKRELINAEHLPQKILYFASTLYNINSEQFKCFKEMQ